LLSREPKDSLAPCGRGLGRGLGRGGVKINFARGSPAAITNDLPSVVCWVSQMASSSISHFLLLRQKNSNQRKCDPGLPPLRVLLGLQPLTTTAYSLRVLRGTLDQPQASGAAQLDLAGRTPRAPLRDSNITSDLTGVVCPLSRMASSFISARLNLRSLATDRGGAQGKKSRNANSKTKSACNLPRLFCQAKYPSYSFVVHSSRCTHQLSCIVSSLCAK
jgi:hypothetical protein